MTVEADQKSNAMFAEAEPKLIGDRHVEEHEFGVDVDQMMNLMIKGVYSKNELFLRELISNSSDACDKLARLYFKLSEEGCELAPISSLEVEIIPDEASRTLTIRDNGIGMTKSDLVNFIGTIASSGTKKFREMIEAEKNGEEADSLIGKFGLGFYSAYLVADKVDVVTKHPRDEALVWSSSGRGKYTIENHTGEPFAHGTSVILYLKEGQEEFLEEKKIKDVVTEHCSFIGHDIYHYVWKEVDDEEEKSEAEPEEETNEPKVEEVKEDQPKKKKKVLVKEKINTQRPLWERNLKEVSEEELKNFYKKISKDWDDYLAVESWRIEGTVSLKLLLFIPKRARFDMFNRGGKKLDGIKLYCSNVFVTDDLGDAVPEWMSFVYGVISSPHISMNISREMVQGRNVMKLIKKVLPQKLIEMIGKLSTDEEKYKTFCKEFSGNLKIAVNEASGEEQERYAKCLRYYTTKSGEDMVSLDTYVERMAPGQKQIYVVTGLGKEQVKTSPFLDAFKKYEVIYMYDVMDEVMLRGFKSYKGHNVQRISSEGVELPEEEGVDEEAMKQFEQFCNKVKEMLSNKVEKVKMNPALVSVPAVVSTTKYSLSSTMENIMRSQPVAEANPFSAMTASSKKIFEMNPNHKIVCNLKGLFDSQRFDEMKRDLMIFFDTILVYNGFFLQNSNEFCSNVFSFLSEKDVVVNEGKIVEEAQ